MDWLVHRSSRLGATAVGEIGIFLYLMFEFVVAPLGAVTAAGEEIGWRGYMLTRLINARVPRPVLVSGSIWAAWHLPLILTGQYAAGPSLMLSAFVFFLDVVAFGYLIAYLRLQSGSIWPAVMAHASWNALIQGVFDASTQRVNIWVGESGILVALVDLMLVLLIVRGTWMIKRYPNDERSLSLRASEV